MQVMTDNDYKLFKSIVKLRQPALHHTLGSYLKKRYSNVHITKDYLFAEGTIPICLVAHMDTVFRTPPEHIYYDKEMGVIWSPEGGCGDDRAGVFAILKILQNNKLLPSVIFTTDEELGGVGANALVKDFSLPPVEFKYIIELDRQGFEDCVFYECDNKEFVKYVESFGFVESYGSFSDISEICPAWGIAGVNLSIGYINEHSVSETVHVNALYQTISKVKKMLSEEDIPEFKYIPSLSSYFNWNSILPRYNNEDGHFLKCANCKKTFADFEMIPAMLENDSIDFFCPDCCAELVGWCDKCGNPFKRKSPSEKICPKCQKGENNSNEYNRN